MIFLADTNILLRLIEPSDAEYSMVRNAADLLVARGERMCYTPQNLVEFWNVCTRPVNKNGFGLSASETDARAKILENTARLLPDDAQIHAEWRRLVIEYSVTGVQVHDARLVASMLVHRVPNILTLNSRDFKRYVGITVIHPSTVVTE